MVLLIFLKSLPPLVTAIGAGLHRRHWARNRQDGGKGPGRASLSEHAPAEESALAPLVHLHIRFRQRHHLWQHVRHSQILRQLWEWGFCSWTERLLTRRCGEQVLGAARMQWSLQQAGGPAAVTPAPSSGTGSRRAARLLTWTSYHVFSTLRWMCVLTVPCSYLPSCTMFASKSYLTVVGSGTAPPARALLKGEDRNRRA